MKNDITEAIEICQKIRDCDLNNVDEDLLFRLEDLLGIILAYQSKTNPVDENQLIALASEASYINDEFEDFSGMIFDIIYQSSAYPLTGLWRVEPFSDTLQEMKWTMCYEKIPVIPFSFGSFDMEDMNNFQIVLNSAEKYDRCDIDNVISILLAMHYEGYCEDLGLGKLYKYLTNEEMPTDNSSRTSSFNKNLQSKNLFSKFSPHNIISKIMFIIKKPEKS